MKRCVIIGAGPIENYEIMKSYLEEGDFFIYCDGGLRHQDGLGVKPDLIVADFASYEEGRDADFGDIRVIRLPVMKDDTDSYHAAKEGLRLGFKSYLLLGLTGARLDHTLANVGLIYMLFKSGAEACMVSDTEEMCVVGKDKTYVEDCYPFFSIMPVFGDVRGLTIKDAKYEVEDARLSLDYPYAISNEPLSNKRASISISDGEALLVKVRS